MQEKIIVVDYGTTKTQEIARLIRKMGFYSEIMPFNAGIEEFKAQAPKGLILTPNPHGYKIDSEILKVATTLDLIDFDETKIKQFMAECGVTNNWNMHDYANYQIEKIKKQVGDKKVLCALSGGVDSSVVAALLHKAVGDQLIPVFVDTGLMRKNEARDVERMFVDHMKIPLIVINAEEIYLEKLKGVTDPEKKRKIIGHLFIELFEKEAKKHEGIAFLAQGTIYPDVIESISVHGKTIKSHHNVGGLPEWMKFELVEPVRELFKDEVRALGLELGLSEEMVYRHPFPGPGLAVRIMGEVNKKSLDLLREADAVIIDELKKSGWYRKIWQAFCVLLNVSSVGQKNEERTYENAIAFRAVDSIDAMSAKFVHLPYELLEKISSRVINEVKGINRVVYDISSKPPATIEWE